MRIKNILSTAAFTVAFIVSTAFAGLFIGKSTQPLVIDVSEPFYNSKPTACFKNRGKSTDAQKMSALITQDVSNGHERDRKSYRIADRYTASFSSSSFASYSAFTTEYAETSGSIKDDGLPQEFQSAWREHMKAWRVYAEFLESMKDSSSTNTIRDEAFKNLSNKYNTEISVTWYEVLRIADEHGADINAAIY